VEVCEAAQQFGDFGASMREFCDEFYIAQDEASRSAMLASEPPLTGDARRNAYCAAVAEHLARRYRLAIPKWTDDPVRFLDRAWFPCELESLKAILIRESPVAFRRRMIFVDADPLYRPRRDKPFL
jgi:hypothetical protein